MSEVQNTAHDTADEAYWTEVADLLEGQMKQFVRAIEVCLEEDLWEPALVLMLSFIDACAWLCRPEDAVKSRMADYISWTDAYLLPDSGLQCTAEDLYGARCGLVHSVTGESDLHRQNKVPKIFWSRSQSDETYTLIQLRMAENLEPIGINIDHLFWALRQALERFVRKLQTDDELATRVGRRVHKSYFTKCRRAG